MTITRPPFRVTPGGTTRPKESPVVRRFAYRYVKRAMDVMLAVFVLTVFLPLLAVIALLIKMTSRGPVLHRYAMLGLGGRQFRGQKFRTMIVNAHELRDQIAHLNQMTGPVFKLMDDPRVTRLGRFLRKFSLDEVPQVWSVLKGDLSFVGPRPPGPYEAEKFSDWHWERMTVKPGMTSLWVVRGKPHDFDEWVRLDIEYVHNWSLWLDCVILVQTIPIVVLGRNC